MIRLVPLSIFALLLLASTLWSQGPDASNLRRKQFTQQQAQALTRQLVSQVLDLQAAQLKQNGLTEVPLYQDIVQMRGNLDHLIREEMQGVVQRLIDAQQAEGQTRIDAVYAARGEIRQVLLALMAERQRLYRRMRLARLSAQVRELIRVQEQVTAHTRELPQLPMEARDEAALANLARQTDAEGMYRQLEEVLLDIRSWGGSLAASAVAGQQILKEAQADEQLQGALTALRQGRFTDAIEHQDAFTAALYKILENIQRAQGVVDNSMESTMTQIEKLRDEQEQLREETESSDLSPEVADQLSQKQEAIQNKLEDMAREMGKMPEHAAALSEASDAAAEAVAELFEADRSAAVAKQDEVLAHLETFKEHLLEQAIPSNIASAEQRKEQVAALTQAKQSLEEALEKQTQAEKQFADTPEDAKAAAQIQRDAMAKLDKAVQTPSLPEAVQPMIAEAKSQANKAATVAERNSEDARQVTADALAQAADATRQALENVASTLADAQRQQLATEVGELARAAEALDRAAAAQQKVSRDASRIANDPVQSPKVDRGALAETQSDVAAVANRVTAGTESMAPQAKASLNQAQQAVQQASESAKALAKDQQSPEAMGQQAQQLQAASRAAQKKLSDAAKALRDAAKDAAQQLIETAGEQLNEIDSVDEALVAMPVQKTPDQTQAVLDAIANEAGMISPEAAARLRQPTATNAAKLSNQVAANDSPDGSATLPDPTRSQPIGSDAIPPMESPVTTDNGGEAKPEPVSTASTEQRVQQARAELAGRRQPIAEDQKAAEQLAGLLDNISGSSEEIQALAEQFLAVDNKPPTDDSQSKETSPAENANMDVGKPSDPQPAENPIAAQLAESMRQFASSQRQATQLAANSAQQSQLANQPVREALQTASRLPVPLAQPQGKMGEGQNGNSSGQSMSESDDMAGKPADDSAESSGSPEASSDSSLGSGYPSGGESQTAGQSFPSPSNSSQSAEMGNSMVSPTPQVTAQALAGQEVMESLWGQVPELFADGDPANQDVASIDPTGMGAPASAMLDNPSSQKAAPNDATAQNVSQGSPTGQQSTRSQSTGSMEGGEGRESSSDEASLANPSRSSEPVARSFEKEPWFTKLPPGTQQAIRASVRRAPPPGYEDRLRRYFENID